MNRKTVVDKNVIQKNPETLLMDFDLDSKLRPVSPVFIADKNTTHYNLAHLTLLI